VSLRARLLIVIGILLFTYAVTAVLVIENQRSLLIDQVDRRLASVPPMRMDIDGAGDVSMTTGPGNESQDGPGPPGQPLPPTDSYSDIFIAVVTNDGAVEPQVVGSLLSDTPALDVAELPAGVGSQYETLGADGSSETFRALLQRDPNGQGIILTALPLQEVEDAIGRLERTLALAGLLIAIVLAALYFWIQRLGIAPIARLAQTAEAITAGDHSLRAPDVDPHTEAGKLGIAFNVMLDERDGAEARLRQFVADASHELRTPLTSMRGYLDLYRQGAFRKDGEMDDVVRRMSSETARMTGLVKDLLSLANLDEGRPLRYDQVDLGRVVRDAAQDAQAVQPSRPIAADSSANGPVICADDALIVQLVSILVTNALDHTPVEAAIALRASSEPRGAVITISDTGPGLDPKSAEHAFDRFWRGESSRQRNASGGSGLGLSIAKGIVDAHHGMIALDTALGRGATFTIHLPESRAHCETNGPSGGAISSDARETNE
jgi:two-component system OmpR family sensor kinase